MWTLLGRKYETCGFTILNFELLRHGLAIAEEEFGRSYDHVYKLLPGVRGFRVADSFRQLSDRRRTNQTRAGCSATTTRSGGSRVSSDHRIASRAARYGDRSARRCSEAAMRARPRGRERANLTRPHAEARRFE